MCSSSAGLSLIEYLSVGPVGVYRTKSLDITGRLHWRAARHVSWITEITTMQSLSCSRRDLEDIEFCCNIGPAQQESIETLKKNVNVRVDTGELSCSGNANSNVHAFKGIPYARPPIGSLRWRAPEPPASWSGVRCADTFGPRCIQPDTPANSISYYGAEPESEDCLYLNVWTSVPERGANLPVMVWFHGGGFTAGSGALPIYHGDRLARRGVVVVTVNYRLGPLGFLVHPALAQESKSRARCNWGLLDQIAALRWVQENIHGFGGDPNCVTIFGQSVGSSSTLWVYSNCERPFSARETYVLEIIAGRIAAELQYKSLLANTVDSERQSRQWARGRDFSAGVRGPRRHRYPAAGKRPGGPNQAEGLGGALIDWIGGENDHLTFMAAQAMDRGLTGSDGRDLAPR